MLLGVASGQAIMKKAYIADMNCYETKLGVFGFVVVLANSMVLDAG